MTDAVAKPIKMAIVKNPKKGYIRTPSPEEIKKYEEEDKENVLDEATTYLKEYTN